MDWKRFHEATLIEVTTDWASGNIRARVRLSEESGRDVELQVAGFTILHCPRKRPWGPSVSINEVRVSGIQDGRHRIEIEVQSGDVIEKEG
ncbi:MAG: hypothetical protein Q8N23_28065 [Archangium sp.]|nr:hypothetical protein [Archangium sp.]MDP3576339.1 hypothetical protein [Archangium sp.]